MRRLLLLAVAAAVLVPPVPAYGGETETFGVSPHPPRVGGVDRRSFGVPMEEGRTFSDGVRVYNKTSEPMRLSVYAADATVGDDGVVSVGFRGSPPRGLGAWIDLPRQTVELAPRAETILRFRVRVASDEPVATLGAVVVESGAGGGNGGLDLVQRVAVLVRPAEPGAATGAVPEGATGRSWWPLALAATVLAAPPTARRRSVRARAGRRRIRQPAPQSAPAQGAGIEATAPPVFAVAPPETEVRTRAALTSAAVLTPAAAEAEAPVRISTREPAGARAAPRRKPAGAKPREKKLNYIPLDDL